MKKKKIVALLPMKANSERVKGKNFKLLANKPLFQWILDSLLEIKEIDQVIINTDAREILIENGLEESDRVVIRDRKPELCGDFTSMNAILEDDIKHNDADIYLMTHTTNPLLSSATIKHAIDEFEKNEDADSLFTVNKVQTRFYTEELVPVNHNPQELIRTQDLEPWYEENSCLYIFTRDSFSATNARIGVSPLKFVTSKLESVDIDEPEDWYLAEALAEKQLKK
ncbi:acylneuraminate cytidylyltransferase family protein [Photobacterium sp. WH24]|uniref:acylneuraminate cytidylyltransferase family protein n=1 Tax=Photobacterium sp. WH24 TaxID=2827237 RepID=UPI001C43A2F6|nr:acylneuraminate cytidylyltransferase family protein [Photobacterium sp. WH24]MBV7260586.1 acylneuraminate cytidylyltransferase family protein [Photobacterium sp. WH24]